MKARQIQTKIWRDSLFIKLTPNEKLLFIFYFTNEFVNVIHFYECPDIVASFSTGLPVSEIVNIKKKINTSILFIKDFVFLKNAWKYEKYSGSDNENAKLKLIEELSPDIRTWYEANTYTPVYTPVYTPKNKNYNKNKNQDKMNEKVNPDDIPI